MGFVVIVSHEEAEAVAKMLDGKTVGTIIDKGIFVNGLEINRDSFVTF